MRKKKKSFATVYALDGAGGAEKKAIGVLADLKDLDKTIWIHLNLSDPRAGRWLKKQPEITDWVRENLTNPEISDARVRIKQNKLLLLLRTVNRASKSDPDDLVFLRLFATEKVLISACRNPTLDFAEVDDLFEDQEGPENMNDLLSIILENTLDSVADSVERIEDIVDDFEEKIIISKPQEGTYSALAERLRQVIIIRRFMMPEREVLDNLLRRGVKWFNATLEQSLRENFDRVRRIVEDIDLLEKRIRVNQDAISHLEDKQTQRNTYMLSVIAGIFLPLSFLTGVFGMNLGGIPMNEAPYGFLAVNLIMIFIGVLILYIFKKLKWI
ncbi:MAG: CorA family divalent cation transporter [Pseudomonadota bacterium]|nr:CorA family divalent cation transporter [Pseudomonadota bacterium]